MLRKFSDVFIYYLGEKKLLQSNALYDIIEITKILINIYACTDRYTQLNGKAFYL